MVVVPDARAASTKSRRRACVVTVSDTRTIGGMNTHAASAKEWNWSAHCRASHKSRSRVGMEGNA